MLQKVKNAFTINLSECVVRSRLHTKLLQLSNFREQL
jgi:hypothetical protein